MISFDRLWETMKQKGVSQYKLIREYQSVPVNLTGCVKTPM